MGRYPLFAEGFVNIFWLFAEQHAQKQLRFHRDLQNILCRLPQPLEHGVVVKLLAAAVFPCSNLALYGTVVAVGQCDNVLKNPACRLSKLVKRIGPVSDRSRGSQQETLQPYFPLVLWDHEIELSWPQIINAVKHLVYKSIYIFSYVEPDAARPENLVLTAGTAFATTLPPCNAYCSEYTANDAKSLQQSHPFTEFQLGPLLETQPYHQDRDSCEQGKKRRVIAHALNPASGIRLRQAAGAA